MWWAINLVYFGVRCYLKEVSHINFYEWKFSWTIEQRKGLKFSLWYLKFKDTCVKVKGCVNLLVLSCNLLTVGNKLILGIIIVDSWVDNNIITLLTLDMFMCINLVSDVSHSTHHLISYTTTRSLSSRTTNIKQSFTRSPLTHGGHQTPCWHFVMLKYLQELVGYIIGHNFDQSQSFPCSYTYF